MKAKRQRWIMYTYQGFPGELTGRLSCHESLSWAAESLWRYSRAVYSYEATYAVLYPFTEEDWRSAREIERDGCPFNDGYSKRIEFGPRGGIRIENY